MTYFQGSFVVLDASVQVDAALSHGTLLIFTAIGGECIAEAFDVLAGVCELGARNGHDEEGDHPKALQ